jgi:hypothetical protein
MNQDQITNGVSQISGATSGLSSIINKVISYFQSLGMLEIIMLILILGVGIYLWIIINQESSPKSNRHKYYN